VAHVYNLGEEAAMFLEKKNLLYAEYFAMNVLFLVSILK
jgi:hypothetical protein